MFDINKKTTTISNNYNLFPEKEKWLKEHPWVILGKDVSLPLNSKVIRTPTEILDYTNINGPVTIKGSRSVMIGRYCDIAENLYIVSSNHQIDKVNLQANLQSDFNEQLDVSKGPVYIGNNVWIGDNVTILTGVTIGDGAVIGAGSVVTKNVPPFGIAAGVPARTIKYRFSEKVRRKLYYLGWWHWDYATILKNKDFFTMIVTDKIIDNLISNTKLDSEKEVIEIDLKDKRSNNYLLDGWGPYEGDSRWVEKKEAGLICKLINPNKYKSFSFNAYSYYKPQKVHITINGENHKNINLLDSWQEYHVPLKKLKTGVNTVRFSFSSGFSPLRTGESIKDQRILYARFTKFSLT